MCDFPLPYSERRLVEDWYNFNDSTVQPIRPGELQSKFGGNQHDGSAYMLVYRQKKINPTIPEGKTAPERPQIPKYQEEMIQAMNATSGKDREAYEDLRDQIDIIIQDQTEHFEIIPNEILDEKMPLIKYKDPDDFQMKGIHCRLRLGETLEEAYARIIGEAQIEGTFELFEVCQDSRNRYCRILRCFSELKAVKKPVEADAKADGQAEEADE